MPKAQFVTVSQAESGQKLLQFLERRLTGDVPRSAIQRWIRKGQVRVEKGRKKPFDRIESGQIVRIPPYTPGEASPLVSNKKLVMAYEDETLLAISKPAGLAVHGGDKIEDSVVARLASTYSNQDFMPTLAHRLDKSTSGLLLAAKSYEKLRELNDLFASGKVGKLYLAWVQGFWKKQGVTLLEDRMEKQGAPGKEKVKTGSGKIAKAKVMALATNQKQSLVAIRLLTGRTHQIRVQLESRNHPIIGDRKYGYGTEQCSMRLHCYAMEINNKTITLEPPWTGQWQVSSYAIHDALELLCD